MSDPYDAFHQKFENAGSRVSQVQMQGLCDGSVSHSLEAWIPGQFSLLTKIVFGGEIKSLLSWQLSI